MAVAFAHLGGFALQVEQVVGPHQSSDFGVRAVVPTHQVCSGPIASKSTTEQLPEMFSLLVLQIGQCEWQIDVLRSQGLLEQ